MDDFEKELKEDFLQEATDLIDEFEQVFLDLERDCSPEVLDKMFRFAHNLKGTSRAVGFGEVAEFTHEVENLILKIKEGEVNISPDVVSLLLRCNDHIAHMINSLKKNFEETFDSKTILVELSQALKGHMSGNDSSLLDKGDSVSEAEVSLLEALESTDSENIEPVDKLELVEDPLTEENSEETIKVKERVSIGERSEAIDIKEKNLKEENIVKIESWGTKVEKKVPVKRQISDDEYIRVALQKVEHLNNYVGELVLLQTVLEQRRFTAIKDDLAIKSISQLGKISKEIQDISMGMRMVPIKSTLQKMNRIVRDTSATLGKKINLHLEGEETEIDKTVLEHVVDPLVHIVRNAVDHGIESGEDRIKAGKKSDGLIHIRAFHRGNSLVIEVEDDGKGIDSQIIRKKAIEKNLIKKSSNLSEQEYINLLFHPGFSTKEKVSEVSGRGVGMDVVKTNIEQLNGEVSLESVKGRGSICRIHLPLTLAIIDGIICKLRNERYIFPLNQINEFLRPTEKMITYVTGVGDCLMLRGSVIPIFDLSKELGKGTSNSTYAQSICVISQIQDSYFAIKVDDVVNQQQVVVKSLGPDIRNQKGFMGGSILGDGYPAFIIDVVELFKEKMTVVAQVNRKEEVGA